MAICDLYIDTPTLSHMGDEDASLIIQLLEQDGEEAVATAIGKGKQPIGTETDAQVAIRLFLEEIQRAQMFVSDMRMTRSIQQAVRADGDALVTSQAEEQLAQEDRTMSIALTNGQDAIAPQTTVADQTDDDDLIAKLTCIYVTGYPDVDSEDESEEVALSDSAEGSAWAASRQPQTTRRKHRCAACRDRKHFAELARAPCGDEYCRTCLGRLFQDAMVDESLFPPRCCKMPIPLDRNRLFLSADLVHQFRKKALELSTPNRTYCHNRQCAAFIPGTNYVNNTASCNECQTQTCITCKGATHGGDCPNDEQLQQVIQLARENGWQRCQNCWGMVELITGCNHMNCRCGFQFCYVCGGRWKTCQCDQWDERRLYERAAQIDARDQVPNGAAPVGQLVIRPVQQNHLVVHEPRPEPPEPRDGVVVLEPEPPLEVPGRQEVDRQRRLQRLMQNLRQNHECDHERWISRVGPRRCEECHDLMPQFIYECRQCQIMACRRCRYHRL